MKKLRIGVLVSSVSRSGGGVSQAVLNLCQGFARNEGLEPVVFGLRDANSDIDKAQWDGISVHLFETVGTPKFGYAPGLIEALQSERLDVLHTHGIWMFPSIAALLWREATGKPLVISPHGMMDPWILGRGRLQKAVAKLFYEKRHWRAASAFHALNREESQHIGDCVQGARILVFPNPLPTSAWSSASRERVKAQRTILYLGRLHPKKNIIGLIQAWAEASDRGLPANCRMILAGWGDEGYVADVRREVEKVSKLGTLELAGPVFGSRKEELLASADFLVLPSFGEGLPMAIAEAWAHGTPTIMSEHCNLPEGFQQGCAIRTGTGVSEIADAMLQAAGLPDSDWHRMSETAKGLSRKLFDPTVLAREWYACYSSLNS